MCASRALSAKPSFPYLTATPYPERISRFWGPSSARHVHGMTSVLQARCNLPDAIERRDRELLVHEQHQVEVHSGLALRRVVERKTPPSSRP